MVQALCTMVYTMVYMECATTCSGVVMRAHVVVRNTIRMMTSW